MMQELDQSIQNEPERSPTPISSAASPMPRRRSFTLAIKDFDQVIRLNPKDAEAFNNRCWARAMMGDLQVALRDCNESLAAQAEFRRRARQPRPGQPEDRPAEQRHRDYNAALRLNPKHASALFGRGKARLRNGDTAGGNADIAAAKAINRDIAEEFAGYGIK